MCGVNVGLLLIGEGGVDYRNTYVELMWACY